MAVQRFVQRLRSSGKTLGIVLATGLATAGLACGAGEEEPTAPTATPTPAAGSPTPAAPQAGSAEIEQTVGELPKAYPSDLPVYPGADPENSMLIAGMGGIVTFATDASPEEVFGYYQEQLPEQGWSIESTSENPKRIRASKGDRRVNLSTQTREDGTEISLAIEGI